MTNADGGITVTAGGPLTADEVVAGGAGSIGLTNTTGNMVVKTLTAADDEINLSSAGAITQPSGAITASGLVFQAVGAVTLDQAGNDVQTVSGGAGDAITLRDATGARVGLGDEREWRDHSEGRWAADG